MEPFVTVARIDRTRGLRGEVLATIFTSFPERFRKGREVWIAVGDREFQEEIEASWFQKGRVVLKFAGRNKPEHANPLVGGEIRIPSRSRALLPKDTFYHSDLIGCRVSDAAGLLGCVSDVFETGEVANLVVAMDPGGELMIPLVRSYVGSLDIEKKEILVALPAGLKETVFREGPGRRKRRRLRLARARQLNRQEKRD